MSNTESTDILSLIELDVCVSIDYGDDEKVQEIAKDAAIMIDLS